MGLVIPNPISLRGLKSPIAYHSLTSGDIPWSWNSKGLEGLQQLVQLSWSFLVFGIMDVETQLAVNGNPRKARKCLESKPQTRKILPGNLPFKAHPPDFLPMESMNILTRCFFVRLYFLRGSFSGNFKAWKVSPPFEKTDESLLLDW